MDKNQEECCLVGGSWNHAGNAGPFYLNLNNATTNSNSNIGTQHLGIKTCGCPLPLGRNLLVALDVVKTSSV